MSTVDRIYRVARDGERLDRIAREQLGTEKGGTVEAILDLNPGLAAKGPFYPAGTRIKLPPRASAEPKRASVPRIWGD
ncbi:tail protein X [Ancylobacter sp. G4_0304]|uniref:tail protein X n=1 Tax=Ancylobacter sp. G4_0304 TaxID=3114289 RepID=UPI0039C6915A